MIEATSNLSFLDAEGKEFALASSMTDVYDISDGIGYNSFVPRGDLFGYPIWLFEQLSFFQNRIKLGVKNFFPESRGRTFHRRLSPDGQSSFQCWRT